MHDKNIYRAILASMGQLTVIAPSGLGPAHDGLQDPQLVDLWLSMKTSRHTRRAYQADVSRFLVFVAKPLSWVTYQPCKMTGIGSLAVAPATLWRGRWR